MSEAEIAECFRRAGRVLAEAVARINAERDAAADLEVVAS